MTRCTYWVDRKDIPDEGYFLAFVHELQPEWLFLHDDFGLQFTQEVWKQSPKTKVIVRLSDGGEKTLWKSMDIDATLNAWITLPGARQVYFNVLNEPSLEDIEAMVTWLIEFMNKARAVGIHLCVGNFDMSYLASHISSGLFDRLLRALDEHYGWHILGVHEYGGPSLPNSHNHAAYFFLDPKYVQKDWNGFANWPRANQLSLEKWGGQYPSIWYILKSWWFVLRARELGLRDPLIAVTEFGWDGLPALAPIYKQLADYDLNGVNTYREVWKKYWPDWSFEDAIEEQLRWSNLMYPSNYLCMCWYAWTNDWIWLKYDNSRLFAWHKRHIAWMREYKPTPLPEPEPEKPSMPIDLLPYLKGDGRAYKLAGQICYTESLPSGDFFTVKNRLWEHLGANDTAIFRGADTSPGGNEMYVQFDALIDKYGAVWCKRHMNVGEAFLRRPRVRWYFKDREVEIQPSRTAVVESYLTLESASADEIVLLWHFGNAQQWVERYTYRKGYGLVKWQSNAGQVHAFEGDQPASAKLPREVIWISPKLPTLSSGVITPPAPTPTPVPVPERTARTLTTIPLSDSEFELVRVWFSGLVK